MKLNWIVIIGGVLLVAVTFSAAFLEGANAAAEAAAKTAMASQQVTTR